LLNVNTANIGFTQPGEVGASQGEINVTLFLFASRSFLANNLYSMIKLIDNTIVIDGKTYNNKRKKVLFKQ
jgi:hypothetical protein